MTIRIIFEKLLLLISVLFSQCTTPSIVVTKEQKAGDEAFNLYDYTLALTHYCQALNLDKKLGIYRNLETEAGLHRKAANCYEMASAYDSALFHIHKALQLDSATNNKLGLITDYRQQGKNFIYKGWYRKSIPLLEKSLRLSEGMEQSLKDTHRLAIAGTYLMLGQLYAVTGQTQTALHYLDKCAPVYKQAHEQRGEMETYLTYADIHADQGNMPQAEYYIDLSEKIAATAHFGIARHHRLRASLAMSAGMYEDALRSQEKALQEVTKHGIVSQIVWTNIGMGDIYAAIGDTDKAERYYRSASEIHTAAQTTALSLQASLDMRMDHVPDANHYFAAEGAQIGEGISLLRMAGLMIGKMDNDSAGILIDRARQLFSEAGNRQGVYSSLLWQGKHLIDREMPAKAKPVLDSVCVATDYPEMLWQAWFHTGRAYEALKNDPKAIEAYYHAIAVIEKIRGNLSLDEFRSLYSNNKQEVYDRLILLLLKSGDQAGAFTISEQAKARAFYDILANKTIRFKQSAPGDFVFVEQEKRKEIQKLYQLLQRYDETESSSGITRGSEMREIRALISDKQSEYDDLVQKIKWSNPEYFELIAAEPVHLSDLQKNIDGNTAILSYKLSNQALVLWCITNDTVICTTTLMSGKELDQMIEETRNFIATGNPGLSVSLKKLYSLFIRPVENTIASITNLTILPNGPLHFLPFQALVDSNGKYLVEKYNITYAPSGSVYRLCQNATTKPGTKFMGMALSDLSIDDHAGLPGTEDELNRILPFFPDHISGFGSGSSETFAKTYAPGCDFIHFATHGIYNFRQPLHSHLLFPASETDDGHLNVYEVFEMDLHAKLTTLSACETGIGQLNRGDELIGLSRAFLFAGSSSVMASLWTVADYQTSLLMGKFYEYLENHTAQEALTMAQREILQQYPQPYYWAPFILIGQGNVMKQ